MLQHKNIVTVLQVARSNDRDRWSNKSDDATSHHHHHHSHQQQASGHQPVHTSADDSHGNSNKKRLNSVDSTNQSETSNTRDKADGSHVRHHHSSGDTTNSRHQHSLATLRHLPLDSDNTVNSQGRVDGTAGPHKVLWHSKPPRLSLTMPVGSDADNRKPIKAEFSPGQGHAGTMWPPTTPQISADGGGVSSSFVKSRNNKSWCAAEQGARTGRSQTMEHAYRAAVRRNTSLVRDTSLRREGGATSGGHAQQTANQPSKHRALQNNNNNTGAGKAPVAASNPTLRRVLSFNNISSPSPQLYHTDATQPGASSRKVQVSHQQRPTAAVRPLHMRSTARESSVPRYSHTPAPAINDTTNLNIVDDQSTYNSDRDDWGNDEVDVYADEAMAERHERILDWLVGVANEGGAERPATPPLIADMPPPQTDTAIHIVYDGD